MMEGGGRVYAVTVPAEVMDRFMELVDQARASLPVEGVPRREISRGEMFLMAAALRVPARVFERIMRAGAEGDGDG